MRSGSCICGGLEYQIANTPEMNHFCCCSICRKLTGSAVGAYGVVKRRDFGWVGDTENLKVYSQNRNLDRCFCQNCGSFLLSIHALDSENFYLSLGSLDTDEGVEIEYQQFVESKACWFELDSEARLYAKWPDWIAERLS